MLDKDKLWLILNIDIRGLTNQDIRNAIIEFSNHFKYDESVNTIIIPSKSDTKLSFYNMGNIEPLMLDEFQEMINNIQNNLIENL